MSATIGIDPGLSFTVPGVAQPAGSKRAYPFRRKDGRLGAQVVDDNRKSKPWKATVAECALAARTSPELLDGALAVSFAVYLPRPKSHFGKRGLRPSAPAFPTVKPDVLKLARAIEDALTGIVWRDDAQIVKEVLSKEYGEPARVEIEVRVLASAGVEKA